MKVGDLVYYDSLGGLCKGVIIDIKTDRDIIMRVTSRKHKVYACGDYLVSSQTFILPRDAIFVRNGQYYVRPRKEIA